MGKRTGRLGSTRIECDVLCVTKFIYDLLLVISEISNLKASMIGGDLFKQFQELRDF